jgi:hypothetical protein
MISNSGIGLREQNLQDTEFEFRNALGRAVNDLLLGRELIAVEMLNLTFHDGELLPRRRKK